MLNLCIINKVDYKYAQWWNVINVTYLSRTRPCITCRLRKKLRLWNPEKFAWIWRKSVISRTDSRAFNSSGWIPDKLCTGSLKDHTHSGKWRPKYWHNGIIATNLQQACELIMWAIKRFSVLGSSSIQMGHTLMPSCFVCCQISASSQVP